MGFLVLIFAAVVFHPSARTEPRASAQIEHARAPAAMPTAVGDPDIKSIALDESGGTLTVPVTINQSMKLNFIVDSGASVVVIPADVVSTMIRSGTLSKADFNGRQSYKIADGSVVPSCTFLIRHLDVGGVSLDNVEGSVAPKEAELLLGQSFLSRISSWSIENAARVLKLGPPKPNAFRPGGSQESRTGDEASRSSTADAHDCGID